MRSFKFVLMLLLALVPVVGPQAAQLKEGTTYMAIVPAQPTSVEDGKVEVVEIFSYGCSHCHRFEPMLERWLKNKPDNVEFVRLPAIFNATLALYARAYYAAEALGVLDQIHQPFFEAIHLQKRNMNSVEAITELFEENGVDAEQFDKAFRSFAVEAKVRRAAELGKRYGVRATPSMVVDGKYITDPGKTGGFRGMIDVVNTLVEKES